jgi:hypothetical protein
LAFLVEEGGHRIYTGEKQVDIEDNSRRNHSRKISVWSEWTPVKYYGENLQDLYGRVTPVNVKNEE